MTNPTTFDALGAYDNIYDAYDNGTGIIHGSAGNKTLTGGPDINDAVIGNAGNDIFVFEVGSGDTVQINGLDCVDLTDGDSF